MNVELIALLKKTHPHPPIHTYTLSILMIIVCGHEPISLPPNNDCHRSLCIGLMVDRVDHNYDQDYRKS